VSSLTRQISAACAVGAIALLAAAPGGSAATSLKKCPVSVTTGQHLGATYVNDLKVHGASCSAAKDVAKAFNKCRKEKGVNGHCTHKVKTYSCTDKRPADQSIPTQFNGIVKCKSASKRVNFTYQQNR
jgi:hypothetical protein